MNRRNLLARAALAPLLSLALAAAAASLHAAPLAVGLAADVTSMDPHFHDYTPNTNIAEHIFDRLIHRDEHAMMVPGLALSWKAVDPLTWEFKLRPGVKFHDGSPFTAEDVKFTFERIPNVKDSPGPFTSFTRTIASVEIVDALTMRIKTHKPHPLVPNDMTMLPIVSKAAAANATTADFNSGKAAIGTGPFKMVRYARGDRIELARNDAYWGPKPAWETVTFRILTNEGSRVAALMAGDVQAIDGVPVPDMARIRKDPALKTVARTGYRLIYLGVNTGDSAAVHFADKNGAPLNKNPLRDLKVRQAISKAISRESILGRVMDGAAGPTGQLVPSGVPGFIGDLAAPSYDAEGARRLLAEAGYPDGFRMTIHGPNNRYLMDDQILQAIAQMLARVGIVARAETMPAATFFPRNNKSEFALSLVGWGTSTVEGLTPLRSLVASRDPQKGTGAFNVGYSNKAIDAIVDRATATFPDAEREKLLQQGIRMAMEDVAIIPIHHQATIWAMRKEISYPGRADERTHVHRFEPVRGAAAEQGK